MTDPAPFVLDLSSIGRDCGISDQRTAAGILMGLASLDADEVPGRRRVIVQTTTSRPEVDQAFGPMPAWLEVQGGATGGPRLWSNTMVLKPRARRWKPAATFYYHFPALDRSTPTVVYVPDIIPIRSPSAFGRTTATYFRFQRPMLRYSRATPLTISRTEAEHLRAAGYSTVRQVVVARLGLDAVPLVVAPSDLRDQLDGCRRWDRPYALHVGRLTTRKNLPRLIRAWHESTVAADLELVLVGPCEDPRLRAAIEDEPGVHYLGMVSEDVLEILYQGSEFVVVPSTAEGFGLPVGEALRRGKRVVASNLGCFAELTAFAPSSSAHFDPASTESIAQVLNRALDLSAPTEEQISTLRRTYSWSNTARDVLGAMAGAAERHA